jgi:drug/metabolite transporter (DMT)-like permease
MITCIGVSLSYLGEINLTKIGFFLTVLCCISSSMKSIFIKLILSGEYKLQPNELMARISPFAAIEMFFFSNVMNEPQSIFTNNQFQPSITNSFLFLFCGVEAYLLNLMNFMATNLTTPLTMNIAGNVKQVVTIIVSVCLFDKVITKLNLFGILVVTIGSSWYSLIGIITKKKTSENNCDEEGLLKDKPKL